MSASSKIRILLVSAEGTDPEELLAQLSRKTQYSIERAGPGQLAAALGNSDDIDVVLVELDKLEEAEVSLMTELRMRAPNLPLIVVSEALSAPAMRQLFHFNVQDWLSKPVETRELTKTIKSAVRSSKTANQRVHAVVSTVGGAGATTVAVSMADLAASRLFPKSTSVALFDLDFSTGNCSYLLDMVNGFDLGSVADSPRRIDAEFISQIQQRHPKHFYLYSFKQPEITVGTNGYELVLRLLDAVSLEHNQTFIDMPYYEAPWKDDVFSAVNTCTLVTELNLPALKHTLDVVNRVQDIRGADFPVRVLINKHVSSLFNQRISKRRLVELFEDTPFFYLPYDASVIGEATDRGLVPSDVSKRSGFIKALTRYMKEIELMPEQRP